MSKYAPHRRGTNNPVATSSTLCQKCLKTGHFTYECKFERPYVSRPSRTQMLENPKLREKDRLRREAGPPLPDDPKLKSGIADRVLAEKEKARAEADTDGKKGADKRERKKAKRSSRSGSDSSSGSDSDSDSSSSGSDSDSSSGSSSSASRSSSESDSRSRSRDRRRKVPSRRSYSR